jgi:hypothetical protein
VHDEVLALVRSKDEVGLAEVMRRERREYAERINTIVAGRRQERPEEENLLEAHDQLLPVWERRLAGLLPVIAYAPERFEPEVRSLVDLLEGRPVEGGYSAWSELLDWSTWWLGYVAGAFALSQEAWPVLKSLLHTTFTESNEYRRHLVEPVRESVGVDVGAFVMARFSDTRWMSPRWEHLIWSVSESTLLRDRWPEFLQGEEPKAPWLADFDLLVSMRESLAGEMAWAYWLIYRGGGVRFARRLRADARYRVPVGDLLGVAENDFLALVGAALKEHARMAGNGFSSSGALNILIADQS